MTGPRYRLQGLLAALALTVVGIVWDSATGGAPQQEASDARPVSRPLESRQSRADPAAVAPADTVDLGPVDRRDWLAKAKADATDLFVIATKSRPASAPGMTEPVRAAGLAGPADEDGTAASLQVIGKARRGQEWEVYLLDGDVTVIAREGDRLPGDRVVEWIRPPRMSVRKVGAARAFELDIGELL